MTGKRMLWVAWSMLLAVVFVLAVAGCSSVSPTDDDSYWESHLAAATTPEEVQGVYRNAPGGSEVEKAAREKLEEILTPRLAAATTFEEVRGVYEDAPYGSEVQKAAKKKLGTMRRNTK